MATTTKLTASNGFYGNSGNAAFTNSAANHLYLGKYGAPTFRSRVTFPSLRAAAKLGNSRIVITKAVLYLRRNDGGGARVTAGCSTSSAWNAALSGSGSASHDDSTGWKTVDVTACAEAAANYTGNWYMHLRSADYIRYNGTGSSYRPYLMITWEYVAATIRGDRDSAVLGETVNFTVTSEAEGETHTLTYAIGGSSGTIAERTGDEIPWTIPESLATEITDDDTGMVEIMLTAFDADGNVQRTERYFQTVTVPESVRPAIQPGFAALAGGLGGYGLTGRSFVKITPVIDMNDAQGASIASVTAQITGSASRTIAWTGLAENAGVFTGESADSPVFAIEGEASVLLTVTDSRGRAVSAEEGFTVCAYAPPEISLFSVERCEPVMNPDEEEESYQASDLGGYVWINAEASVSGVAPEGEELNRLGWTITATNAATGEILTASGTGAQSLVMTNNRGYFPDPVEESAAWNYVLTVADSAGSRVEQYSSVAPAIAPFAIAPDGGGASFGGLPTGTKENPLLESHNPGRFYEGIFGVNRYESGEVATGGVWTDGKPIYRRVMAADVTQTDEEVILDSIEPDTLICMKGTFVRTDGVVTPIPYFYDTNNRTVLGYRSGAGFFVNTSKAGTVLAIADYTKTTDEGV